MDLSLVGEVIAELEARGWLRIGLNLLLILGVTLIALRYSRTVLQAALRRLFAREALEGTAQELSEIEISKRSKTLDELVGGALRVIIVVIGFLMGLTALGLDIGPAIAGLGIVGLALSLGAQHLVRDYVAGAFILIENQYAKGDIVKIADVTGTVEDLSLRRTTLRSLDGTVHSIPHGLIGVASNLTRIWARIELDVTIQLDPEAGRPDKQAERLGALVDRVGREMTQDPSWGRRVLEAPRAARIQSISATSVTIRVLGSVRAAERWEAAGEVRRRLLSAASVEGLTLSIG